MIGTTLGDMDLIPFGTYDVTVLGSLEGFIDVAVVGKFEGLLLIS